eukprot:TRINITY_DN2561_c0_g3_i1.p1 TRINITY_DN2561_c0_g3~~TRINITY_DN2561_c0_g3_i1.p1  ORF type:complete len:206 (+),score=21.06 TRINITY_DN2561_c0_g3_i1:93-710(+)
MTETLTEEEAALYDRQLRLWGVEAQQRLRRASILLIGFTATQSEICKNVVLAGVKTVTINDTVLCSLKDTGSHLFLTSASVGRNRASESLEKIRMLNPNVEVHVTTLPMDEIDLDPYNLICVSGIPLPKLTELSQKAYETNKSFFICDSQGYFAYMFQDVGDFFKWEKNGKLQTSAPGVRLGNALEAPLRVRSHPIFVALRCIFL